MSSLLCCFSFRCQVICRAFRMTWTQRKWFDWFWPSSGRKKYCGKSTRVKVNITAKLVLFFYILMVYSFVSCYLLQLASTWMRCQHLVIFRLFCLIFHLVFCKKHTFCPRVSTPTHSLHCISGGIHGCHAGWISNKSSSLCHMRVVGTCVICRRKITLCLWVSSQ